MLQLRNLHAYYGHIHAVKGVSLHVMPHEIVALIGGNGAGKSTILRAVSGIVKADSGDILLEGEQITPLTPERILKNGIGHVPEGRRLFRGLSVRDNMILGAYTRRDKARIKSDIDDMERLFPSSGRGGTSSQGHSRAASSRCWPLPGRSWPGPRCCF